MLRLQHISLLQFKNYKSRSIDFNKRITGICGKNSIGKTNLLDAIHYLCFTRSYFSRQDQINVQHDNEGFRLEGTFLLEDKHEKALCVFRETGKKEFSVNDQVYDKFSQHIGRYPCVVIAPDDAQLVTGGSEERRKFLDALLAQVDAEYLQQLILYNKVLQQRNSTLRFFAETNNRDNSLLDVLDEQLSRHGETIFNKRKEFLLHFLPLVKKYYDEVAANPAGSETQVAVEDVLLTYESELHQASFRDLLQANRNRDCMVQRTTSGIHRDDLDICSGKRDFKSIASQGQRKSLLFALKLAEMEILKNEKGFAPLLLLDDVFEKLDGNRIGNLLNKVCVENEGQVFITDTNKERLGGHLSELPIDFEMIQL